MTLQHSKAEARRHREFPMFPMKDDSGGMLKGYRITCAECGAIEQRRRSNAFIDDVFRKVGWEVGHNEKHDRCPACIKGKVIHMADRVKMTAVPQQAEPEKTLTRDVGRILSRTIEDHWDEAMGCYHLGWSDTKLAEANGTPVEWVKAIRERDFGGVGEDPGLVQFLAAQIEIKREIGALTTLLEMASNDLGNSTAINNELGRKLEGYRNGHRRLFEQVTKLDEVAAKLTPAKKAG